MITINHNTYKINHSTISDIFLRFNLDNPTGDFDLEINRNDIANCIKTSNNSADIFFKSYLFVAESITLIKNNRGFFIKFNYENFPNPEFKLEFIDLPNVNFRNVIVNQQITNKTKSIVRKQLNLKQLVHQENLFAYIPYDIIVIIIGFCNEPTILLADKNLLQFISDYKDLFLKMALQRELNNAIIPETFPPSPNHKFKINQRIIVPQPISNFPRIVYNGYNCRIIEIKNKWGKYIHVDLYGNKINDEVYIMEKVKLNRNRESRWLNSNKQIISLGILACDNGPRITSTDSHYFKYKYSLDKYGMDPDINVIVLIKHTDIVLGFVFSHPTIYEYVICDLDTHNMRLECIDKNNIVLTQYLLANKIDGKWIIISNDSYQIEKIGCHINGFCC